MRRSVLPLENARSLGAIVAVGVALCGLAAAAEGPAAQGAPLDDALERSPAADSSFLDTPPFPGFDLPGALRAQAGTFVAPDARVGSGHVSLVRPQLGLRATWPVNDRWALRISSQASASRYRFRGRPTGVPSLLGQDLDLYAARLSLEGAYRMASLGPWFDPGEHWSVLGSLSGSSRWENGGFESGLGATGVLGVGYEIPDRLRVGLGISLRTSLDEGGVEPGPFFALRWHATERLTLHTHGLGLRLEYDVIPQLALQLTGARASDAFRLRNRSGVSDDLTFRDRYLLLSAGAEWALTDWLRLGLDVGGTAERRLGVRGQDLGTLVSRRADPSVFFDLRAELRL